MSFKWNDSITEEQKVLACEGKICPQCLCDKVKCVGAAPDGRNMNYAYDCLECAAEWEGY